MTFGEKAVGLTFNPGGNEKVTQLKKLYAEVIDVMNEIREENRNEQSRLCSNEVRGENRNEQSHLCSEAIREAQSAQMWAVKAITWSY